MKDEEGYVRIVGRIKDIIIRGGEDITPLEIEEAILAYDQVSEAKGWVLRKKFWVSR
jgi:fatty-acyl-CoA synthase